MGRGLLIIVSGLMIVSATITGSVNNQMRVLPQKVSDYYHENQARNFSMGLIDQAIEQLKNNKNWEGILIEDKFTNGRGTATLRTYTVNSTSYPALNGVGTWNEYRVLLYSESTYDGYTVATEVLMEKKSYSQYAYFTNYDWSPYGGIIWWNDADTVKGPMHTNWYIFVDGSPEFQGLVTTPYFWWGMYGSDPQFKAGTNFNAPRKNMPTTAEINKVIDAAGAGGLRFNHRIEVDLYTQAGGSGLQTQMANIRETDATETYWNSWQTYDISATNGVISTPGRIDVYGEVSDEVTIHSERLIEIDGDITYFEDPRTNPDATNMLGLISEGDVRVDRNAHRYSGSSDLTIQASIMALDDVFYVEDHSGSGTRGELNLLGGVVQNYKGPVATTTSSGSVRTGYEKRYDYDTRFKNESPPFYPREEVYSIVYWKDKVVTKPSSGTTTTTIN